MNNANHWKKLLITEINSLGHKYDTWHVFNDFVTLVALVISNHSSGIHFDERKNQYLNIIKKYDSSAQLCFREMHDYLVNALTASADEYRDILGEIYQELLLTNKHMAQDFTPQCVSQLMSELLHKDMLDIINSKGFFTLSEPTVGSGSIVIACAENMLKNGLNPSTQLCVTAVDLDFKCACMSFIQMAYYGIPAVVIHGDTILVKEFSRWYTPVYIWKNWIWRCKCSMTTGKNRDDEIIKRASDPMYAAIRDAEALMFQGKGAGI